MATKPKSKPRTNTSKSNQLTQFKFRWWMALILVGVVAVIGIVILRFSHAGTGTVYTMYVGTQYYSPSGYSYSNTRLYNQGNVEYGTLSSGARNTSTGIEPVKVWFFSNNTSQKYGCLKTTNYKNVTKADLPNGSGPYQFIEQVDKTPCT